MSKKKNGQEGYTNIAWIIILVFYIVSIIYWNISDAFGEWALTGNPILVTILNFVTNPFYLGTLILIFLGIFKLFRLKMDVINTIKVSIASIMISLAIDILTLLHSIPKDYNIPSDPQTSIYFDTVTGKLLKPILTGNLGWLIPTLMIIFAIIIIGIGIYYFTRRKRTKFKWTTIGIASFIYLTNVISFLIIPKTEWGTYILYVSFATLIMTIAIFIVHPKTFVDLTKSEVGLR